MALTDILPSELTGIEDRIVIASQYTTIIQDLRDDLKRLRSPGIAKNLNEVYALVKDVIDDYERRENTIPDARINFTEEDPDYLKEPGPHITFDLISRVPGLMSSSHNSVGNQVRNLVPILREEIDDTESPGYKRAILGFIHDNEIRFTVWAKTNKVANAKALWFEGLMQEYRWYFVSQGVARILFLKREADKSIDFNGQKFYGRPIHFHVRTETLTTLSQKTLEQITVGSSTNVSSSILQK